MSETFPWTLAHETATGKDGLVRWSHGMVPFLGGRSTVWSAWCPVPNREEMEGWPDETIKAAEDQMLKASELLNVQSVSDVDSNRTAEVLRLCNITSPVYGTLQVGAPHAVCLGCSLCPRFLCPAICDTKFVLTCQSRMVIHCLVRLHPILRRGNWQ